ncbi:hypothetical protein EGH21_01475 [Halomicroarcula sp. F13]|uniref:Transcriptional regulator n=1 Tax=Haloarcula rubra TaxID=2487747 RepID=A0AAW4PLQ9_9EURY|nr:DUF5797 family protein [Halomicroarcula rubra]MBX0321691.1 hypothetical protein [Halomicroarcula rubra]
MTLSEAARERLADIVANQPTKNGELQDLWDMDSGSEVHQYLESELKEYYYRNEDSLICATPEATELIDGEGSDRVQTMTVTPLQQAIVEVIAGPDEESQSVVSVLHALRDAGEDPDVDDVRSALRGLADKGLVETVQKTVPTFRLAIDREDVDVEVTDA